MKIQLKRLSVAAIFGGLCILVCTLSALADSQARIVRLSQVKGDVKILRGLPADAPPPSDPSAAFDRANSGDTNSGEAGVRTDSERAILNMPVSQGMKVSTGTDGLAEIEFEDGAIVRLTPESQVEFPQLILKSSGEKDSTIRLISGEAYFKVNPGHENRFVLLAGNREIPLTHAAHLRAEIGDQNVNLALFAGSLELKQEGQRLEARKGQEATLDLANNTSAIAQSIAPGRFDDWDKQRGEYHNAYYTAAAYQSYPYYGRGDLNYYGNWYSVPGFGSLWQPSNTALGWNPFSGGVWSWNPGLGYLWASQSPWGWLPYHYGSWSFVPGWGWGWAPGASWGAPLALSAVVNPPVGFVVPVAPRTLQQPVLRASPEPVATTHAGSTVVAAPTPRAVAPVSVPGASERSQFKLTAPPVLADSRNRPGTGPQGLHGPTPAPNYGSSGSISPGNGSRSSGSVHH